MEFGSAKHLKKKNDKQVGDGQHEGEVQGSVRSQALDALRVCSSSRIFHYVPNSASNVQNEEAGSLVHQALTQHQLIWDKLLICCLCRQTLITPNKLADVTVQACDSQQILQMEIHDLKDIILA